MNKIGETHQHGSNAPDALRESYARLLQGLESYRRFAAEGRDAGRLARAQDAKSWLEASGWKAIQRHIDSSAGLDPKNRQVVAEAARAPVALGELARRPDITNPANRVMVCRSVEEAIPMLGAGLGPVLAGTPGASWDDDRRLGGRYPLRERARVTPAWPASPDPGPVSTPQPVAENE